MLDGAQKNGTEAPQEQVGANGAAAAATAAATTDANNGAQGHLQQQSGKSFIVPSNAMKRIKQEERDRGKREALAEFEARVKAAGFDSFDELANVVKAVKSSGAPTQSTQAQAKPAAKPNGNGNGHSQQARAESTSQPSNGRHNDRRTGAWERERERLTRTNEQAFKKARVEEKRRRELQKKLDEMEAEMGLREAAVRSGVRDVDYAIRLLTRSLEGKSEADIKAFDESQFFANLKNEQPYLFGEVVRPATTGTAAAAAAPAPPKANVAQTSQASGEKIDATKMDRKQFEERLRALGLNYPNPV